MNILFPYNHSTRKKIFSSHGFFLYRTYQAKAYLLFTEQREMRALNMQRKNKISFF